MSFAAVRSLRRVVWTGALILGSLTVVAPARAAAQALEHSQSSTSVGPVLPRHFDSAPHPLNTAVARRAASSAGATIYISTAAIIIGAVLLLLLL